MDRYVGARDTMPNEVTWPPGEAMLHALGKKKKNAFNLSGLKSISREHFVQN